MTHQEWLHAAYAAIREELLPEAPPVEEVIVSYGFPKYVRSAQGSMAIGQCFYQAPEGKRAVIFIRLSQWGAPIDVLHVLVHEAIHAAYPGAGHKGAFKHAALRVGLEGRMTATIPGPAVRERLNRLAERLPTFPAGAWDFHRPPTGSRLRLYECSCPVKVRVASDYFAATCDICGQPFLFAELSPSRRAK